jgi:acetylornithine deacetylase/succinyl-diaminopimelate desuccinylase-like protein
LSQLLWARVAGIRLSSLPTPTANRWWKTTGGIAIPFAGVQENGRFYGWAIADDLSGVAASVSAMAAIKSAGIQLKGDMIVASTLSKRNARSVVAVLHHGYGADAAIYLHHAESGVGMNEIRAFASGQLQFTVTVTGKSPETTSRYRPPLRTAPLVRSTRS